MAVGVLEQTVTVSGEAPIIDVQGTTRQSVIEHEIVDVIPAGRGPTGFYSYGLLLPGVVPGNTALQDVGGSSGTYMVRLSAHGGDGGDQLITQNGVGVGSLNDQGWFNRVVVNVAATRESAIDTAGISAEFSRGGVHVNIIPKDGGNRPEGTLFYTFANSSMQSSNITQELIDGMPTQGEVRKTTDFNPGFGGPLKAIDCGIRRRSLQFELEIHARDVRQRELQQSQRVDLRRRREPPGVQRLGMARRAGAPHVAGDAEEQDRPHLGRAGELRMPARHLRDRGTRDESLRPLPEPAAGAGRLDGAGHQPGAVGGWGAGLLWHERQRAAAGSRSGDDLRL